MNQTNDALWLIFEALAKRYPQDGDVRLTADMSRWMLRERRLAGLPVPSVLEKVMDAVTQELDAVLILEEQDLRTYADGQRGR